MASEKEINQRLRSLHRDFDFLLDNHVISTELYDELTQQIPRRYNATSKRSSTSAVVPSAVPVTSPSVPSTTLPSETAANTNVATPGAAKSLPPPTPNPASPPPSYALAQVEVLYDYRSNDEGDLNLTAGQRVTVLEYVNNDWWRGEGPNGQQGIFPSNYVRKIEAPTEKGAPGPPAQYGYQQYPGQQYQQPQQPNYGQTLPYQQDQPVAVEEKKSSKFAQFGKDYGKTFVNATAWGGGMALGADVINSII